MIVKKDNSFKTIYLQIRGEIDLDENKYEVNIYTIENEDSVIEELSMIVKKDNSFKTIYLQIRGEIDLDQIANVASELNAPGGDFLKKIN
jgi:acetolactate synthase regulatory subunit